MTDPLSLDLSAQNLSDFRPPQLEPYAALDVSDNPLESFAFLTSFPRLRVLRARNANLFEFSQFPRSSFRGLSALDVSDNNLTTLRGLSDCAGLETLDVSGNPLRANAERGLTCALPKASFVGFRGAPVHGLLLAQKLASDALGFVETSKSRVSAKNNAAFSDLENSSRGPHRAPISADSFDFGAVRLAVAAECFPSDGRLVFALRCEPTRGPLYEPLEVAAYAVGLDSVNLLKRVALIPHTFNNVSGSFQNSSPDAEIYVRPGGRRESTSYVLICAGFRGVLRSCVFDVGAGGA